MTQIPIIPNYNNFEQSPLQFTILLFCWNLFQSHGASMEVDLLNELQLEESVAQDDQEFRCYEGLLSSAAEEPVVATLCPTYDQPVCTSWEVESSDIGGGGTNSTNYRYTCSNASQCAIMEKSTDPVYESIECCTISLCNDRNLVGSPSFNPPTVPTSPSTPTTPTPPPTEPVCIPQCDGRQCGHDGCDGSCGTCEGSGLCSDAGQCGTCVRRCQNKQCGPDGCQGVCGHCNEETQICHIKSGKCINSWKPPPTHDLPRGVSPIAECWASKQERWFVIWGYVRNTAGNAPQFPVPTTSNPITPVNPNPPFTPNNNDMEGKRFVLETSTEQEAMNLIEFPLGVQNEIQIDGEKVGSPFPRQPVQFDKGYHRFEFISKIPFFRSPITGGPQRKLSWSLDGKVVGVTLGESLYACPSVAKAFVVVKGITPSPSDYSTLAAKLKEHLLSHYTFLIENRVSVTGKQMIRFVDGDFSSSAHSLFTIEIVKDPVFDQKSFVPPPRPADAWPEEGDPIHQWELMFSLREAVNKDSNALSRWSSVVGGVYDEDPTHLPPRPLDQSSHEGAALPAPKGLVVYTRNVKDPTSPDGFNHQGSPPEDSQLGLVLGLIFGLLLLLVVLMIVGYLLLKRRESRSGNELSETLL